jgi:hypothetical protein
VVSICRDATVNQTFVFLLSRVWMLFRVCHTGQIYSECADSEMASFSRWCQLQAPAKSLRVGEQEIALTDDHDSAVILRYLALSSLLYKTVTAVLFTIVCDGLMCQSPVNYLHPLIYYKTPQPIDQHTFFIAF